ncbi:sigma-54-dependent transcriptional regulator [Thioalkalivibrio halophilus]|uniref:Transcriptional regulator n=1 Tax=Thioalkalivibrio halophilus TaxID=252474 RepID=A0A1V3A017_9GAMM|nr:sigma-54 dependent transcriptional regulator [Thioalkalivibrio halophilus]OOC10708.1 transcriptional regulator [Thioalkalivibrio halophilus]
MTTSSCRILLVEDDPIMGESLYDRFELEGFEVTWCQTAGAARETLEGDRHFHLMVSDIRLPDLTGDALFAQLQETLAQETPRTLFITGYGAVETAVDLLKRGAADYITKPFDLDALIGQIRGLCAEEDPRMQTADAVSAAADLSLGKSLPMQRMAAMLPRVAARATTVLITGESGAGKEFVAHALHNAGPNPDAPFVAVNCAALPENLLEAELFGHEKGAFTGATRQRRGVFEQADGGTLFLDEIGDMSLAMQAKLLRVIQERQVTPLGSENPLDVNLRLVCATHRNLREYVDRGDFREDLFYRINVVHLRIPPLRDRREDILWLARQTLEDLARREGGEPRRLAADAEQAMLEHEWPGNVRELRHCLERATIFSPAPVLGEADLCDPADPDHLPPSGDPSTEATDPASRPPLADYLQAQEAAYIRQALEHHEWRITQTAEHLGISRKNLWEKMRRHGLQGPGAE